MNIVTAFKKQWFLGLLIPLGWTWWNTVVFMWSTDCLAYVPQSCLQLFFLHKIFGGRWTVDSFCLQPSQWRHNGRDGVLNHQPHDCLLNRLFRRRSKKTSKLRVTGLWAGNSTGTGEFPSQMASNAENVSIWWRHYDKEPWRCYLFLYIHLARFYHMHYPKKF